MTDQHPATPPAPEQPASAPRGAEHPSTATDDSAGRGSGAPLHGVGPFTLREAILVGIAGLMLLASFFSMYDRGYASIWGASLDWVLGVALPVAAGVMLVIRRLSPATRVRVGSLSVDQFASVAFSVAAVLWLSRLGYGVQNVVDEFPFTLTGVVWLELLLSAAGVFFTVAAPFVAPFKDDFSGRAESVAHPAARPPRPVVQRPRPEPQASQAWPSPHGQPPHAYPAQGYGPQHDGRHGQPPQWGQPAYGQPQWGQPSHGQQHGQAPQGQQPAYGQPVYGQPQFPPPGQTGYGQPEYGQQFPLPTQQSAHAPASPAAPSPAAASPAPEGSYTSGPEAVAEVEAHGAGDPSTPREDVAAAPQGDDDDVVTTVHPILSDDRDEAETRPEPVWQPEPVSQDELATQPAAAAPAPQAFWALAPEERDVVDAYGTPLFRIGPTAWALVIEDRGDSYVVRHDDGRIGFLHDVSGITRG